MPHDSLSHTDHRPWPLPERPWRMRQVWNDLLFAHWPVPKEKLRPLVPDTLTIQEFDGTSWIGVVPFYMSGVTFRPFPALPWLSAFPELNLRLYVEHHEKPGVWFLSLDAARHIAVWIAQTFFHLPYFHADMNIEMLEDSYQYQSIRKRKGQSISFESTYKPTSEKYRTESGSLEHFLTERYCLYASDPHGNIYRTEVHHKPWPLQKAEADFHTNQLADPHGIPLNGPPTLLHFSKKLDVITWMPEKISD